MYLYVIHKNIRQNAFIYSMLKHQGNTDILHKNTFLILFQCYQESAQFNIVDR